jgi:hypothetical protein
MTSDQFGRGSTQPIEPHRGALQMRADIVPVPVREHCASRGPAVTIGAPDAVDGMVLKPSAFMSAGRPFDQLRSREFGLRRQGMRLFKRVEIE